MTWCRRHAPAKKQKSSKKIITNIVVAWKAVYLHWCVAMACGSADTSDTRNATYRPSLRVVLLTSSARRIGWPVSDLRRNAPKVGPCIQLSDSFPSRLLITLPFLEFANSIFQTAMCIYNARQFLVTSAMPPATDRAGCTPRITRNHAATHTHYRALLRLRVGTSFRIEELMERSSSVLSCLYGN